MKIVSDSGPLLSFARAGRLQILRQILDDIVVPDAVFHEIAIRGKGKPGAATWMKRQTLQNRSLLNQLSNKLNLGEMEALALA